MTIDWWTLALQTVNVAILVWLLQRFFWRPGAAMIQQRRDETRRSMEEVAAAKAQAKAEWGKIEQVRAGFAGEREAILAAARAEAATIQMALLADARRQASAHETAAQARIEQASREAAGAWTERSARLAVAIAGQLAARLDGAAVRASFLDWLVREIAAQSDAARQAVMTPGAAFEVISATALDAAEQEYTREKLCRVLGGSPSLVFRVDPGLVAGLELHGPHLLVANSWRADLERILAGLIERGEGAVRAPEVQRA